MSHKLDKLIHGFLNKEIQANAFSQAFEEEYNFGVIARTPEKLKLYSDIFDVATRYTPIISDQTNPNYLSDHELFELVNKIFQSAEKPAP